MEENIKELNDKKVEIEVENLSYKFKDSDEILFKNLNFTAKTGDVIGITGVVASGKSTLSKVLSGLYKDYGGSIKINNTEIKNIDQKILNAYFVRQDHKMELIKDSIDENIKLGLSFNTDEAIKLSALDSDLYLMEEGKDTNIGPLGSRLSGGQKSRLSLARTLYNKKPIIILDDPFTSLDSETESKIWSYIRNNFKENIIFIISHRLNMFSMCDGVIFIDKNKECFYGKNEYLLVNNENYKNLNMNTPISIDNKIDKKIDEKVKS